MDDRRRDFQHPAKEDPRRAARKPPRSLRQNAPQTECAEPEIEPGDTLSSGEGGVRVNLTLTSFYLLSLTSGMPMDKGIHGRK